MAEAQLKWFYGVPRRSVSVQWNIFSAIAHCTLAATRRVVRSNSAGPVEVCAGRLSAKAISWWKFWEQCIEATISLTTLLVPRPVHINIQHQSCHAHGYRPQRCEAHWQGCLRSNASDVLPPAPCNPSLPDLRFPRLRHKTDSQSHRSERNTRLSSRPRAVTVLAYVNDVYGAQTRVPS